MYIICCLLCVEDMEADATREQQSRQLDEGADEDIQFLAALRAGQLESGQSAGEL